MTDQENVHLTGDQVSALSTIMHHYKFDSMRKSGATETELAKDFAINARQFNNFLNQGSPGAKDGANIRIYRKLMELANDGYFDASPSYIRRAILIAFPSIERAGAIIRGEVGEIFARCASEDEEDLAAIDSTYSGVFDIYRYAAHLKNEQEPRIIEDPDTGNKKVIGKVVRAAMQIFPREPGAQFARFQLKYKPYPKENKRPANTTDGSLIVIGQHMYFIGYENGTKYPLVISCLFDREVSYDFYGLVLRKHDKGGPIFSSRVYFRKNGDIQEISELDDELCMDEEINFPEDVRMVMKDLTNDIRHGGKGGLLLGSV